MGIIYVTFLLKILFNKKIIHLPSKYKKWFFFSVYLNDKIFNKLKKIEKHNIINITWVL